MSVIEYILLEGSCEVTRLTRNNSQDIELRFTPECSGFIRIGSHTLPVRDGKCIIKRATVTDGTYTPFATLSERSYTLPRIKLEGGRAELLPLDDLALRSLSVRVHTLEQTVKECSRQLCEVKELINGKIL